MLSASGQLGYGIPEQALAAGIARQPDFIGCDMGSVDPGPVYLGSGEMATSPSITKRDLAAVLTAARKLNVPLVIGTAGTAGASPHLEATLDMIREISREHSLHFRLATIRSDLTAARVGQALSAGQLKALGGHLPVTQADLDACSHLVGQIGCAPFERALALEPDVIIDEPATPPCLRACLRPLASIWPTSCTWQRLSNAPQFAANQVVAMRC